MANLKSAALAASIALGLVPLTQAAELRLNAPATGDLVPAHLVASKDIDTRTLDRAPVRVSWALSADDPLNDRPVPFVRESREYWLNASEAELRRGIALPTTAEAALIRISPHGNNVDRLTIDDLVIRSGGRELAGPAAVQNVADATTLRAAGMDVPDGTVIAKLAPAAGMGNLQLAAPAARGSYLIHVFEPASSTVLRLGTARDTVVAGQSLRVNARLDGARAATAKGILTAPDGHSQPFDLRLQPDGSWQADVVPDAAHASGLELWEVHAFASGGERDTPVLRDAKTAFALSRPTARLTGHVRTVAESARGGGLGIDVGVDVANASRYQLAGVLYGTASDGTRKPMAYAQSAAWLDAGAGRLTLSFDAASMGSGKLAAPYELRDLRLSNQADMSLLERRERAVEIR
ncbi:MAG: hypothetical protein AMXMBFR59_24790 [Rhodanobacteraceae bacterium]